MNHGDYIVFLKNKKIHLAKFIIEYESVYILDVQKINNDNVLFGNIQTIPNTTEIFNIKDNMEMIFENFDYSYRKKLNEQLNHLDKIQKFLIKLENSKNMIIEQVENYKKNNKDNINEKVLSQLNKGLRRTEQKIKFTLEDREIIKQNINQDRKEYLEDKWDFTLYVNELIKKNA